MKFTSLSMQLKEVGKDNKNIVIPKRIEEGIYYNEKIKKVKRK